MVHCTIDCTFAVFFFVTQCYVVKFYCVDPLQCFGFNVTSDAGAASNKSADSTPALSQALASFSSCYAWKPPANSNIHQLATVLRLLHVPMFLNVAICTRVLKNLLH